MDFDFIIIGSGFGGSVMSCRLVEKGYKVCLLERGRRWSMFEFPRRIHDVRKNLFWDPEDKKFGFMEVRDYPESDLMSVTASGLGGGSLIYANVLMPMDENYFYGWPGNITKTSLDPYYDRVLNMMEAKPYPFHTDPFYRNTPKTAIFAKIAEELTTPDDALTAPTFVLPSLAIRFTGDFPGQQSLNQHGALQSKCTKCGECDIGCNIHAKNTLDLNYLHYAQDPTKHKNPLTVLTESQVTRIKPLATGGYGVTYCNPKLPAETREITGQKVIVSGGSLGSTALLLRMKKEGHLPKLNEWLGKKWCGNGDLEGTVLGTAHHIDPTNGPVITGAIKYRFKDYPDGYPHGCTIQEAGFPIGLAWYLSGKIWQPKSFLAFLKLGIHYVRNFLAPYFPFLAPSREINIGDEIARAIDQGSFINRAFLLLGMGRDRSDGEIKLRDDGQPVIHWKINSSQLHYDRVRKEMQQIAEKLKGHFVDNPLTHFHKIVAVHPIGGCPMADTPAEGLVGCDGQSFDYPGLYVVDASIIPTSLGPNPSLTIAALAERIADMIPKVQDS
jgi:cholesterol oxidase